MLGGDARGFRVAPVAQCSAVDVAQVHRLVGNEVGERGLQQRELRCMVGVLVRRFLIGVGLNGLLHKAVVRAVREVVGELREGEHGECRVHHDGAGREVDSHTRPRPLRCASR